MRKNRVYVDDFELRDVIFEPAREWLGILISLAPLAREKDGGNVAVKSLPAEIDRKPPDAVCVSRGDKGIHPLPAQRTARLDYGATWATITRRHRRDDVQHPHRVT